VSHVDHPDAILAQRRQDREGVPAVDGEHILDAALAQDPADDRASVEE
jgi:hypothetical protein